MNTGIGSGPCEENGDRHRGIRRTTRQIGSFSNKSGGGESERREGGCQALHGKFLKKYKTTNAIGNFANHTPFTLS
jgi:hypothetical protein